MDFIQPYDNDDMTYNEKVGRYILTRKAFLSEYDSNYNGDDILDKRLKKCSRAIYAFIFNDRNVASFNVQKVKSLLNHTQEGRKYLYDVFMAEMDADNESGILDLATNGVVNFETGNIMDEKKVADAIIAPQAKDIIFATERYFGFNLFVSYDIGDIPVFDDIEKYTPETIIREVEVEPEAIPVATLRAMVKEEYNK